MGGHGGLNILQQKSWHVWKADNIKKVEDDEAAHREQIQAGRQRERDVRSELRYAKLKGRNLSQKQALENIETRRSRKKRGREGEFVEEEFQKVLLTVQTKKRKLNPEEEKAALDLKMKEMEGMRLGNSSVELNEDKPWWMVKGQKLDELNLSLASKGPFYKEKQTLMKLRVKSSLRKHAEDPFSRMQARMGKKVKMDLTEQAETTEETTEKRSRSRSQSKKKHKKKKKKEKKKKKKRDKEDEMAKLRAIRERRERKERKRAELLRRHQR